MTDKWAEYREKFCGCKDASRLNSCRGRNNCELPAGHPERVKAEAAAPPSQHKEIDMTDTISVPRELLEFICSDNNNSLSKLAELRAIVYAPAQPAQVQGWAMVPVEPTPKMIDATWYHEIDMSGGLESQGARNKRIYEAMLATAPKPPVQEPVAWIPNLAYDRLTGALGGVADPVTWGINTTIYRTQTHGAIPLYAAPQPSDDAKDAARYRFLKSKCDTGFITNLEDNVFVSRWDAAIDAAMAGGMK